MERLQKFLRIGMLGGSMGVVGLGGALMLRYLLHRPQPLTSMLEGDASTYTWKYGQIFYKRAGNAELPPLVLLHTPEIGGSSYEMRYLIKELAHAYQVYALDLPGFGLSDRPALEYTAETYITVIRDFLCDVVQRPAVLLASGLSCKYSIAIASREPLLCTRLIFLSPQDLFLKNTGAAWLANGRMFPALAFFIYALLTPAWILRPLLTWQQRRSGRPITHSEFRYLSAAAHQYGAQHAAIALLTGKLQISITRQLESLQQPVFLIEGGRASHAELAELLHKTPQAQVAVISEAGLRVQEEAPERVSALVLAWEPQSAIAAGNRQREEREEVATLPSIERSTDKLLREVIEQLERERAEHSLEPVVEQPVVEKERYLVEYHTEPVRSGENQSKQDGEPLQNVSPQSSLEREEIHEPTNGDLNVQEIPAVEAYCVKCRQKREMTHAHKTVTKNGRSAMEGICPICATRLFRFIAG
ncbi:alpha/beta fold hydrolase [Tengunoibacter tsumagoiensis]|uniref:AB hydrolase-1 domain-containing protein n=1 Tax=Tengunoibacter tsumagoiensis TaxID=2014871 RepID=A0A402A4X5_9CHLR|nr:alpha/beta fold hydrolase [Tengunoibacter tsumagoiensis]GCE14152.1 hypothetical protein KTT_40110 [Tengunoibacter tsumagoiensis]